eukprot:1580938-Prorocentrum_lima.AAC.1
MTCETSLMTASRLQVTTGYLDIRCAASRTFTEYWFIHITLAMMQYFVTPRGELGAWEPPQERRRG